MAIVRDLFWNPRFVMSTFAHRKCHFVSCFRSPNYRNEQMAFENELMLNTFQNKQSFNLFWKIFLIENTFVALPYQWMAWIAGLIPWPIVCSLPRMACCEALFTLILTVENIFKSFTFFHLQHLGWFHIYPFIAFPWDRLSEFYYRDFWKYFAVSELVLLHVIRTTSSSIRRFN